MAGEPVEVVRYVQVDIHEYDYEENQGGDFLERVVRPEKDIAGYLELAKTMKSAEYGEYRHDVKLIVKATYECGTITYNTEKSVSLYCDSPAPMI